MFCINNDADGGCLISCGQTETPDADVDANILVYNPDLYTNSSRADHDRAKLNEQRRQLIQEHVAACGLRELRNDFCSTKEYYYDEHNKLIYEVETEVEAWSNSSTPHFKVLNNVRMCNDLRALNGLEPPQADVGLARRGYNPCM